MIPVIIGAAALAAGAAGYALGKSDEPKKIVVNTVTQKAEVSEDYVKWQLERAGKNLQNNSAESLSSSGFVCSNSFSKDFERIEDFLVDSTVSDEYIADALNKIERRAKTHRNNTALNFVNSYREKLRYRNGLQDNTSDFSADFERIDNMLSSGFDVYNIKNELQLIELRAKNRRDVAAMNTVANYYERIGHYQKAWHCRETLKTF